MIIGSIFSQIVTALMPVILIAAGVFLLYALIKYENARPYLAIVFCMVMIGSGVYSSFVAYNHYTAMSSVNGEFEEVSDPYKDLDIYNLDIKDIAWYKQDDGTYSFTKTFNTSKFAFDGTNRNMTLLINNRPCDETISTAGQLQGLTKLYIRGTDGKLMHEIALTVNFTFYVDKVVVNVTTDATNDNVYLLKQYVGINGFKLRVLENILNYYEILTEQKE